MFTVRAKLSETYIIYHFDNAHDAYTEYCELSEIYKFVDCFIGFCRVLWSKDYDDYEPLAD